MAATPSTTPDSIRAIDSGWFQKPWTLYSGQDSRWYRYTPEYSFFLAQWKANGGLRQAVDLLNKGGDNSAAKLTTDGKVPAAYAKLYTNRAQGTAQQQYEKDLFDWWWTTSGMQISYTKDGKKAVLKSGVIFGQLGIFDRNGNVVVDRKSAYDPRAGEIVTWDAAKKTWISKDYRALVRPANDTSATWWRQTLWFKNMLSGKDAFAKRGDGTVWNKSWLSFYTNPANANGRPELASYISQVTAAYKKGHITTLSVLLEKWLSDDKSVFGKLPLDTGYRIVGFLHGSIEFTSNGKAASYLNIKPLNLVDKYRARPLQWFTPDPNDSSKVKKATAKSKSLFVFGDSISGGYFNGGKSWVNFLSDSMTAEEKEAYRDRQRLNPDGYKILIRQYEAWVHRPIRSPHSGDEVLWRGLFDEEAQAFAKSCETGESFQPYLMDY